MNTATDLDLDLTALPYLVQRLLPRHADIDEAGSFDSNLRLDYMGSAEFEFGIPDNLKKLLVAHAKGQWLEMPEFKDAQKGSLRYLAMERDSNLEGFLTLKLKKGEYKGPTTKEALRLPLPKNAHSIDQYCGWWDIENAVVWCFGEEDQKRLDVSLSNTREKFIANGRMSESDFE